MMVDNIVLACRFVFEDQIEFIKDTVMAGENVCTLSI